MGNTKKKAVKSAPKTKKTAKKKVVKKTISKKNIAKKITATKKKVVAKTKAVAKKKTSATKKITKKTVPIKKKPVAKKTTTKKAVAKKKAAPTKKKTSATKKSMPTRKKAVTKKTTTKKATAKKSVPIKKKAAIKKKTPEKIRTAPKMSKKMESITRRPVVMPRTIPGKRKKITAKDRNILKKNLQAMSSQFAEKIKHLKENSLVRNDAVISPEDGTDVFDRQFNLSLASAEQKSLAAIYDALKRLEEGTYGICDSCGDIIGTARLKALPFVKMCINCKSDFEKDRARPRVYQ